MIGQPRIPGRHRAGRPHSPGTAYRRVWDGPARAQAEALERSHTGWVVLYGPGSRRFYAIVAWPVPEPVMVEDSTAEGLKERMHQAETVLLLRATTSAAGPGGPGSSGRTQWRPHPSGVRRAVRPAGGLPYPPEGGAA